MSIGTNIYALRKERKVTQARLAEILGVSEQAISKWENDQCAPDVSFFPIMAEYFGVSIDRIFGYHINSYAEEVKAVMKAADDSMDTYREIEIISEGLKKYPNSPDFCATDKIFACENKAQAYMKMGRKEECLEALRRFFVLADQVRSVAQSADFNIAVRNPIYFSGIGEEIREEYMPEVHPEKALARYDKFFGDDEEYLQFKADVLP